VRATIKHLLGLMEAPIAGVGQYMPWHTLNTTKPGHAGMPQLYIKVI